MHCELKKVSVVILNFNGLKLMQQYLPIVIKNTIGAEIVVADNGSTDGSNVLIISTFLCDDLRRLFLPGGKDSHEHL